MKKGLVILGSILGLALIIFMMYRSTYNTAINLQENVDEKWGMLVQRINEEQI